MYLKLEKKTALETNKPAPKNSKITQKEYDDIRIRGTQESVVTDFRL